MRNNDPLTKIFNETLSANVCFKYAMENITSSKLWNYT